MHWVAHKRLILMPARSVASYGGLADDAWPDAAPKPEGCFLGGPCPETADRTDPRQDRCQPIVANEGQSQGCWRIENSLIHDPPIRSEIIIAEGVQIHL